MNPLSRILHRLKAEQRPLRWLWLRTLSALGLGSLCTIDRGLYRVRLHRSAMPMKAMYDPSAYRDDEAFLKSCLEPGDLVVDIGANVGFITLASAAMVGGEGHVVSCEAHPTTFERLQSNVDLNHFDNVQLVHAGLGDREGTIHISDTVADDRNAITEGDGIEIRSTTLDALLRPHDDRIALLKVDVEGYEKFVFEGGRETLGRTDCVYFEVAEEHFKPHDYRTADLISMLDDHGFDLYRLDENGQQIPVPADFSPARTTNLVARRSAARTVCRPEPADRG